MIKRKRRVKSKVSMIILCATLFFTTITNYIEINAAGKEPTVSKSDVTWDWFPKEAMYDKTLDNGLLTLFSNVFDPVAYAWYNPDVLESGITTDSELFNHWVTKGIYEGRRANLIFNVDYFISSNPQLKSDYIVNHMEQAFKFCSDFSLQPGIDCKGYTVEELKEILVYNPNCNETKYIYTMFALLKNNWGCDSVEELNDSIKNGTQLKGYNWNYSSKKTSVDFPPRKSENSRWNAINNYYHDQEIKKSNNQWGIMKEGMLTWEEVYVEHVVNTNPVVKLTTDIASNTKHTYYGKNITQLQMKQADDYCYSIAQYVLTNPQFAGMTDLQRIDVASRIVANRCSEIQYGKDGNKYYKSPYGVAIGGIYTCAGATRTMGRVLEYMGIQWAHVNENENCHQWCVFYLDGVLCCADGMGGFATYGDGVSYPCTLDGTTIWPATWRVVYSFK